MLFFFQSMLYLPAIFLPRINSCLKRQLIIALIHYVLHFLFFLFPCFFLGGREGGGGFRGVGGGGFLFKPVLGYISCASTLVRPQLRRFQRHAQCTHGTPATFVCRRCANLCPQLCRVRWSIDATALFRTIYSVTDRSQKRFCSGFYQHNEVPTGKQKDK